MVLKVPPVLAVVVDGLVVVTPGPLMAVVVDGPAFVVATGSLVVVVVGGLATVVATGPLVVVVVGLAVVVATGPLVAVVVGLAVVVATRPLMIVVVAGAMSQTLSDIALPSIRMPFAHDVQLKQWFWFEAFANVPGLQALQKRSLAAVPAFEINDPGSHDAIALQA